MRLKDSPRQNIHDIKDLTLYKRNYDDVNIEMKRRNGNHKSAPKKGFLTVKVKDLEKNRRPLIPDIGAPPPLPVRGKQKGLELNGYLV